MTEYIEKEAAIDAVHGEFDECLVWDTSGLETANVVENVLDTLPPADVRPVKRGAVGEGNRFVFYARR